MLTDPFTPHARVGRARVASTNPAVSFESPSPTLPPEPSSSLSTPSVPPSTPVLPFVSPSYKPAPAQSRRQVKEAFWQRLTEGRDRMADQMADLTSVLRQLANSQGNTQLEK